MKKIFENEISEVDLCIDKDFITEKKKFSARLNKDGFSKGNVKDALETATFERFFVNHRDDLIVSLKAYSEEYKSIKAVYMAFGELSYGVDVPEGLEIDENNAGAIIHSIVVTLYTNTDLRDKEQLVGSKYGLYIEGDEK